MDDHIGNLYHTAFSSDKIDRWDYQMVSFDERFSQFDTTLKCERRTEGRINDTSINLWLAALTCGHQKNVLQCCLLKNLI